MKVQSPMQTGQPEVVPVVPSNQSAPAAPPQVCVVQCVLMSSTSNLATPEKRYLQTSG